MLATLMFSFMAVMTPVQLSMPFIISAFMRALAMTMEIALSCEDMVYI